MATSVAECLEEVEDESLIGIRVYTVQAVRSLLQDYGSPGDRDAALAIINQEGFFFLVFATLRAYPFNVGELADQSLIDITISKIRKDYRRYPNPLRNGITPIPPNLRFSLQ